MNINVQVSMLYPERKGTGNACLVSREFSPCVTMVTLRVHCELSNSGRLLKCEGIIEFLLL